MAFSITQGQVENYIQGRGFLTSTGMEAYLSEQQFVINAAMIQFVTGLVRELVPEQAQVCQKSQDIVDRTNEINSTFDATVSAASASFEERQAELMTSISTRDAQLREHFDSSHRSSLELGAP